VTLALGWATWVDFLRFVVFKSTWCHRCRKRKIIAWEMTPKESAVGGWWMCMRCDRDRSPQAVAIIGLSKKVSGLHDLMRTLKGWLAPSGPLPDYPSEPVNWTDDDPDNK
jgi:hypothetical protein